MRGRVKEGGGERVEEESRRGEEREKREEKLKREGGERRIEERRGGRVREKEC